MDPRADELSELVLANAHQILAADQEIHPSLHLILPDTIYIPTVVAWKDTEEKHLYFKAFSKMIHALKPEIILFAAEVWMSKKPVGSWFTESPSKDPERSDAYCIIISDLKEIKSGYASIITSPKGKRTLGPMDFHTEPITGPLMENLFKSI